MQTLAQRMRFGGDSLTRMPSDRMRLGASVLVTSPQSDLTTHGASDLSVIVPRGGKGSVTLWRALQVGGYS